MFDTLKHLPDRNAGSSRSWLSRLRDRLTRFWLSPAWAWLLPHCFWFNEYLLADVKLNEPAQVNRLLSYLKHANGSSSGATAESSNRPGRAFEELAVETWRLRHRVESQKNLDARGQRMLTASVSKLEAILSDAELAYKDHTGEDYVDGMSVKVLSVEESEDLMPGKRKIVKTVRPSITHRGVLVAWSEVIVAKSLATKE